jgi:ribosomal protein S26
MKQRGPKRGPKVEYYVSIALHLRVVACHAWQNTHKKKRSKRASSTWAGPGSWVLCFLC